MFRDRGRASDLVRSAGGMLRGRCTSPARLAIRSVRSRSDVQRVPERAKRSLLHGLAQGWVRVDRAGHVFQLRAHFDRLHERRGQFRHRAADGLPADVLPSRIRAQPCTTRTPFFFSSAPTPPGSRPTMPSFHATVREMSIVGAPVRMPSGDSPA
jgi:hypothetical protein